MFVSLSTMYVVIREAKGGFQFLVCQIAQGSVCFGKHKYVLCEYAIIEHEKPVEESGFFPAISCRLILFFCCFRLLYFFLFFTNYF